MKHVYSGRDEMDAHFVKGLLEQEGIEARVMGAALESAFSTLPLSDKSLPSVWVLDDDEPRARVIVDQYRQVDAANANDTNDVNEDAPRPTWKCPNCGQDVEEQFTQCWNCGHERPCDAALVDPSGGPH